MRTAGECVAAAAVQLAGGGEGTAPNVWFTAPAGRAVWSARWSCCGAGTVTVPVPACSRAASAMGCSWLGCASLVSSEGVGTTASVAESGPGSSDVATGKPLCCLRAAQDLERVLRAARLPSETGAESACCPALSLSPESTDWALPLACDLVGG